MAGRGVDILLGGNPEVLAAQEVRASGLDPDSDEGQARYAELLAKYEEECEAEGEKIRELGGLYVLGSERHESRRIDNQLRGRSGRQGDPGESRFFLSLEDELMRLFATGAMNWVMGRALPDDVPIDSKMVTKAIERAQNTVEARNAEIRKDVLKYDEVMNEQRKVIYARRDQILEGEDLRARTIEVLGSAIDSIVTANCAGSTTARTGTSTRLLTEARQYFPTTATKEELGELADSNAIYENLAGEAIAYYEQREELDAAGRRGTPCGPSSARSCCSSSTRSGASTSRRWTTCGRASACGPWASRIRWWRGSATASRCSASMMSGIDDDYVKIVMHAQVQVLEQAQLDEQASLRRAQYAGGGRPGPGQRRRCTGPLAAGPAPGRGGRVRPGPATARQAHGPGRLA